MISEALILGGIITSALGGNGALIVLIGFIGAILRSINPSKLM